MRRSIREGNIPTGNTPGIWTFENWFVQILPSAEFDDPPKQMFWPIFGIHIWRLVHSLSVKVSGKIQIPYPLKAFRVTYPTPRAWKIVKCPGYAGGSMLQVWIDYGEPGHFLDLLIYDMHTAGINYVQSTMCGDRQRDMKNCHSREINVLCHGMSVGWRNTQPTHKSHIHISS